METIKVSINVNIDFSENVKSFLNGLFSAQPDKCADKVVQQVPTQKAEPAKAQEQAQAQAQEQAKPATSAPSQTTTAPAASSAIKIDQVRKALAEKVNDHRAAIKAKLEELGAPSVTKLDASKYEDMYNFLVQL